jgi:hypothetical protein
MLVVAAYGDVEVEFDEGVGSPADGVYQGGQGQGQGHVLHTLRLDHYFLFHTKGEHTKKKY